MYRLVYGPLYFIQALFLGANWFWRTQIFQNISREILASANRLGCWYIANRSRTIPGTLGAILGWWLADKFDTPFTRSIMAFAGIPMFVFFLLAIASGALLGAGIIELRRPYGD